MCSAKGREKVIKRVIVGQIDCGQLNANLVSIAVKQVVVSDGNVEQVSRSDTRRVLIVVLCSRCWDADES